MSDSVSKVGSVGAVLLAAANIWFTAHVNTENQKQLERTKTELQIAIKRTEQRIEQTKAITTAQNNTYLQRLPDLQKELEAFVTFAERVADGTPGVKDVDGTADRMRTKILFVAASCEPRPDDTQLAKSGENLEDAVELLRQSIIDESIDESFAERSKGVITAWKRFQAEVFRVAMRGYD